MNPCDHPHGGGEGRSPIGRKRPITPWGKAALGVKTRKKKKSKRYLYCKKKKIKTWEDRYVKAHLWLIIF